MFYQIYVCIKKSGGFWFFLINIMLKLIDFGDLKEKKYGLFLNWEGTTTFFNSEQKNYDVYMMICVINIWELKKLHLMRMNCLTNNGAVIFLNQLSQEEIYWKT